MRKMALALGLAMTPAAALGQSLPAQIRGQITEYWVESSSSITIRYSAAAPCGSDLYSMSTTAANVSQMVPLLLTAAASNKAMILEVHQCSGTTNLIDHGALIP